MIDFDKLGAYECILREELPDVQSTGYLLRHKKSGARVMLLENEDENKVFNIAFRTTPEDSTGVAHIMEHTVLCGSRKFPAKDPFVELVKGSMNTFLNAMTYPDKTMYPVASCNDADFANLMEVYLDAVFYPNIYRKEEIFRQEGWHYQLERSEDPIVYNGVVYNEMKGAYSSPDDVLEREIMASLFPDTVYHHESGGDPERIPDLTYQQYLEFHRTYYHPCNSYIYLYGNMDFTERLIWLDKAYLSGFEEIEVHSAIGLQPPFTRMQVVEKEYPIGANDDTANNTYLAFNTVVGTSLDTKLAGAFAILSYVLLEAPGAPLKQALLDAQIGKDIMSSYDSGIYQPVFSVIAKEAEGEDRERFLQVIRETLSSLAREGLDEKAILAAVNMMEFRFREADYGAYPKGLMYGIDVFDSWLYADDRPFDYLKQLEDFAFFKTQTRTDYFPNLIRTYLLENPHATLLVVKPRKGLTALAEQETKEKLAALKASLSDDQVKKLVEETAKLRAFQETPSTKEELEKIPMLTREDLGKKAQPFSNDVYEAEGALVVHHDYPTNGIAYLNLLFDASCVSPEELPYLGLLKHILGYVDTAHYGYGELFNEINLNTGGISVGLSIFPDGNDAQRVRLALGVMVRTLYDQIDYCFDMISEILFTSNLAQEKRLLEILRKIRSRLNTRLTESGSATAVTRCMSYFSPMYRMNDCFGGVAFYDLVKDLEHNFQQKKGALIATLQDLVQRLLQNRAFLVSYTGSSAQLPKISAGIAKLHERLAGASSGAVSPNQTAPMLGIEPAAGAKRARELMGVYPAMELTARNEGLKTPGKVQYVARCGNFKQSGYVYNGALKVLKTIMSYEYLWSQVRVVGGAYGCGGSFLRTGDTSFSSYRDPQLERTLQVYEGIPDYLKTFDVDDRDMTKYVIGTVSDMDTPLGANAKGSRSMNALMGELGAEQLQRERDEVLSVTQEDIRALAPLAKAALDQGYVCVLGNEDRIESCSELFGQVRDL